MTTGDWLAFFVLVVTALVAGSAVTISNGAVTRAIYRLERTYRRQKSLELERLHAQLVAQRRAEVEQILARPDGWRRVLNQVLADVLPDVTVRLGDADPLEVAVVPVPRFTVQGTNGMRYTFTTSPEALQLHFGRRMKTLDVVPLDASFHPSVRTEVQAVWEYLEARWVPEDCPLATALPRQAEWFLVVREQARERSRP